MTEAYERFKATLDQCHEWPCDYVFKFIAPRGRDNEIAEIFEGWEVTRRPSRTGKYVSVTAKARVSGSSEVVAIYLEAEKRGAIVSL